MIKTLKTLFKQDKEKFIVPKSVQAVIPLKTMWEDGIFLVGRNKYAMILSISVDTFFTRISIPKLQHPEIHNISVV